MADRISVLLHRTQDSLGEAKQNKKKVVKLAKKKNKGRKWKVAIDGQTD